MNTVRRDCHQKGVQALIALLTVMIIILNPQNTHAKRRLDRSSTDIQYAQEMIQTGQRLLKEKRYREAISYFERSQARVPEVNNLFTIGAIYTKIDRCPQALSSWSAAQLMCGHCALSAKLEKAILKHTNHCSSEVSVQSIPRAQLIIDGEKVGSTPYQGRILHGSHIVQLLATGHSSESIRVQAGPNRPVNIDLTLSLAEASMRAQASPKPLHGYGGSPTLFKPVEVQAASGLSADSWLAADRATTKRQSVKGTWKMGLSISAIILGSASAALYGYVFFKHNQFDESEKSSRAMNIQLYNEVQSMKKVQIASGVLGGLALTSLISSLLISK